MTVNTAGAPPVGGHHAVPLATDIVTAASALAATLNAQAALSPYILYEKGSEIRFAAGEDAVLRLDSAGLHLTAGGETRTESLGTQPLAQIHAALAGLAASAGRTGADWRAYGWAAFEFSYLLHGLPIPPDAGPLLYLVLPRHEAVLRPGTADLQITDRAVAAQWAHALGQADVKPAHARVQVDEINDTSGYLQAAADTIRAIDGTRLRKVILSRSVHLKEDIDLIASYLALRRNNTPARSFLLQLGGIAAAGVSPQAIVEVSPSGGICTQPLAGTRALTGDPARDACLREELLTDPKEIYEHALSVKLAQDEITAVSAPGTVVVEDFMEVVLRGSVQHLASRVCGQRRSDATCWDAFASVFPAVTASGIPKRLACAEIGQREHAPRGLYSGAVLTVDGAGGMDAALVLRSVYQKDGVTWLRAGAGLIAQSIPERELEETREKLRSVSRFLVPRAGMAS